MGADELLSGDPTPPDDETITMRALWVSDLERDVIVEALGFLIDQEHSAISESCDVARPLRARVQG